MTIREAFQSVIKPFEVDATDVNLALLNAGLDGDMEYSISNKGSVEQSAIDLMFQSMSVTSESESQYSTSKDAKIMRERLLVLARKYGRKDIVGVMTSTPVVRNISRIR